MKIRKMNTAIHNHINEGQYAMITEETKEENPFLIETDEVKEKKDIIYRGLKEKEKEFVHLVFYKYNQSNDFSPIVFDLKELMTELNVQEKHKIYFKSIVNNMIASTTTFNHKSGYDIYSIFSRCSVNEELNTVTVEFNHNLIDYLYCDRDIKLINKWSEYRRKKRTITKEEAQEFKEKHKGGFTITSHVEMALLKSSYAMELFEKLSQFVNLKEKIYTMKEIREVLSIPKSYKPAHIKTNILELSKKQINENTSLKIDYEILGTGQRQSIRFLISSENSRKKTSKKKTIQEIEVIENQVYFEDKSLLLSLEEEETALKILKDSGLSEVYLKNMKKKSIHMYWATLRTGLSKSN